MINMKQESGSRNTNLPILAHGLTVGVHPGPVRLRIVVPEVGHGGDHVKVQSDRLLVAIVNLIMGRNVMNKIYLPFIFYLDQLGLRLVTLGSNDDLKWRKDSSKSEKIRRISHLILSV